MGIALEQLLVVKCIVMVLRNPRAKSNGLSGEVLLYSDVPPL